MQQSNERIPSVVVIGGIEVGKTSIINSTWPTILIKPGVKDTSICHKISDDIPGRGVMSYTITEMPSILFSLPKRWINDENKMSMITEADVILFIVSADSIGYKLEMAFLKMLLESQYYKGQRIIVCLSKSDSVLCNAEENTLGLEGVKTLLIRKDSLYKQVKMLSCNMDFEIDFVVPVSATFHWNLDTLRERIWERVISCNNDATFIEDIPTIVIAGKRGCGKSSTLNRLWDLGLPTNKAVACTKYPMVLHVEDEYEGGRYCFNVVDLPGIAESLDADMQYTAFYKKFIKNADLLICLSQADTRAYLQDEVFYKSLMAQGILTKDTKIVLGINQIDLLFKDKEHLNGVDLETISEHHPLIEAKIEDYYGENYSKIFKDFPNVTEQNVCAFSVLQNWNMNKLKSMIYSFI